MNNKNTATPIPLGCTLPADAKARLNMSNHHFGRLDWGVAWQHLMPGNRADIPHHNQKALALSQGNARWPLLLAASTLSQSLKLDSHILGPHSLGSLSHGAPISGQHSSRQCTTSWVMHSQGALTGGRATGRGPHSPTAAAGVSGSGPRWLRSSPARPLRAARPQPHRQHPRYASHHCKALPF